MVSFWGGYDLKMVFIVITFKHEGWNFIYIFNQYGFMNIVLNIFGICNVINWCIKVQSLDKKKYNNIVLVYYWIPYSLILEPGASSERTYR